MKELLASSTYIALYSFTSHTIYQ